MSKSTPKLPRVFLPGLLLCVLAALLPALLLYLPNTAEIPFADMLPHFGILLVLGLLAWAGMYLITRRRKGLSALAAAVWLLVLLNVGRLVPVIHEKIDPLIGIKVIGPVVLVFLAAVTFGLSRLKEEFLQDAVKVLALALAAVVLTSAVTGLLPKGEEAAQEEEETAAEPEIDITAAEGTVRSNIYWILSDEYSGSDLLSKYYHYDNTPFYDWLREKGFTVSEHSYNWHHDTYNIIQGVLYLRYMKYSNRTKKANVAAADAPLWTLLRSLGYELCEAESTDKFRLVNRLKAGIEDNSPRTAGGDAVANLLLQYSVLYRWENEILGVLAPNLSKKAGKDALLAVFDWAGDPANLTGGAPTFTVVYFQCPHAPYYFDRKGNPVPEDHQVDEKDKKYYLDQLVYTTGRLKTMVEAIQASDPEAVIVLQSDHGNRTTPNITELDYTNVLNAVYLNGESLDGIKDRNVLNTWITVLDRLFNLDIPNVEEKRLKNRYYESSRDPALEDPNEGLIPDK